MRQDCHVRSGQPDDAERLAVLAVQVWLHTYCTSGISGEVAHYVLSELTVERFAARLTEPGTHVLVAERDECLLGFAVIKSGAPCPSDARSTMELQTLYVQEHCVGRGIGRALLDAAEAEARQQSAAPLWLTVNAQNTRAIGFYTHRGYAKVGTAYFVLGQGRHENHVLLSTAP